MSGWDIYERRVESHGKTKRESFLLRETRMINSKLKENFSYTTVTIDDEEQDVAIINTDNLNEKKILAMPGKDIKHGGLVRWMDNFWLITEKDVNSTIYTYGKMIQCNHLLKWVSDDGTIHEQWCIIEDGTKYLTGEYEDRNFVVTRGDSRIAMTIARNEHTIKFDREYRFLIDDPDSSHKLAYLLTKPLKLGAVFNNNGVYKFVLQEVTATEYDNHELGIADYYKHFSKESDNEEEKEPSVPDDTLEYDESKRWL